MATAFNASSTIAGIGQLPHDRRAAAEVSDLPSTSRSPVTATRRSRAPERDGYRTQPQSIKSDHAARRTSPASHGPRRVQDTLTNPYAGAVVYLRRSPDEAINWNGRHPHRPASDFERVNEMRAGRDRAASGGRAAGGREDHYLSQTG